MKSLAIIGAGASGLAAAIEAAEQNPSISITIFEKMQKPAKKILATGNGRCNFANCDLSPAHFYGNSSFLRSILTSAYADSEGFFRELGVLPYYEDGRIYPRSQQASTIKSALLSKADAKGIKIITEAAITEIKKTGSSFIINAQKFDAVIIAGGGKAACVHGSDGSCYRILESFGHKCTPLYPALTGLITNESGLNLLKGVRAECEASLYSKNRLLGSEIGEVQFTDNAVSGIPVMNLSQHCESNRDLTLALDLCPEINAKELSVHLTDAISRLPDEQAETILNGIVNLKLGYAIINRCYIKPQTLAKELTVRQTDAVVSMLKRFEIKIKKPKGFDFAQVTKGGIKTDSFNPETLMSELTDGLFACGELLDIHGDCGGYNLHLAWVTGRIAGAGAGNYLK